MAGWLKKLPFPLLPKMLSHSFCRSIVYVGSLAASKLRIFPTIQTAGHVNIFKTPLNRYSRLNQRKFFHTSGRLRSEKADEHNKAADSKDQGYSGQSIPRSLAKIRSRYPYSYFLLKWASIVTFSLAVLTLPWTFPKMRSLYFIVKEQDEIDFERSKKNSEANIDYERAVREQVLVDVAPKSWFEKAFFQVFVVLRTIRICISLTPILWVGVIAYMVPALVPFWGRLLHRFLASCGGCWIKAGQWVTTRPDIFPATLIETMTSFQDKCTPHSFEATEQLIRQQYGMEISELFSGFGPEPIAAGAVAQVYKATLNITGEVVAVKVLHPNVAAKIQVDLAIMDSVAKFLTMLPGFKWFSLEDGVHQFSSAMLSQLDMQSEAKHLMRFCKNFENDPDILFPRIVDHMATKDIMVETFETGQPLAAYLKSSTDTEEKRRLARVGLRAYLNMLMVHNFVHADLHPGNMLVRKNPNTGDVQLVFLDVGLVSKLNKVDWLNFKELFKCVVKGDGAAGARLMVEHAKQTNITEEEKEQFSQEMGAHFIKIRESQIEDINIGLFISNMFSTVRKYHVRIDTNFATLCVGTVLLEGIGRQLDPDINIIEESLPLLMWSEKATIEDRAVFFQEKMKDQFTREDRKHVPIYEKLANVMRPFFQSLLL